MGMLVEGRWNDVWYETATSHGAFIRKASQFRHWVTRDGAPGESGAGGFRAEAGRYHLYVSLACPWAHRALIFRKLKRLEGMISLSVVNWLMREEGWTFAPGPGVIVDDVNAASRLYDVYLRADARYSGRVTVPVLWDKKTATIVSNESSEIIRMFGSAFDEVGAEAGDYYPGALRPLIDEVNQRIYDTVNNGVYKAGFATTQSAYDAAIGPLFDTLDWLETRLGRQRYVMGDQLTEVDWRLFTTLIRFDPVYVGHFKCNRRRVADYRHLSAYLRDLYQHPGIAETCDFDHIKGHYYQSHLTINPTGIVPAGPDLDLLAPHGRG